MAWNECDCCGTNNYSEGNPFVEYRTRRPSDPTDMCCAMAGHARCLNADPAKLPSIADEDGLATQEQWQAWIESAPAQALGYVHLG